MAAAVHDANSAVMDAEDMNGHKAAASCDHATPFRSKTRSLSDGNGSQWSPLPFAIDPSRKKSKDDSMLGSDRNEDQAFPPATPLRPRLPAHGLSLQMLSRDASSPVQPSYMKPAPLSPMVDHSHIYASPTNILPRRSRGLDFSRAATSLHHSTLAEQSSPDSSPTIGGRAMNIPRRSNGGYGAEQSATRLRSIMGSNDRMHMSSSVSSVNPIPSDSSSSCDEDDPMDDEMEDAILSTPQVAKDGSPGQNLASVPWMPSASPSISSLSGFRTRPRKQFKKKLRGLASLSYNLALPRSPPRNPAVKDLRDSPMAQPRRDSISWAANQLHISGLDNEERSMESVDPLSTTPSRDGTRGVIKKVVTRRGNLLPKTKGFARIRAALAEEGAPVDSEVRREAEVIRQVRESDMDLEPRTALGRAPPSFSVSNLTTAQSSPKLNTAQESSDEIPDDDQMSDFLLSSSFKQQAVKNSKGKNFWDVFSENGSVSGMRITPPPITLPRGSSSGISEDVNMDSPSMSAGSGSISLPGLGMGIIGYGSDSQKAGTPQPTASATPAQGAGNAPPTAAEITRRIHYKRRREDDFDPHVFKRRAVSPGMSAHNSPIMQSPLQRDSMPWGSRPGSNHGGDKISGTPSENGSSAGNSGGTSNTGRPIAGGKGRVGFQGMNDTNDGLMRMSIE